MNSPRKRSRLSVQLSAIVQFVRRRGTLIALVGGGVAGLLLGLAIGWLWWPVEWTDAAPVHLRSDFQRAYILQVARRYAATNDSEWAYCRLGVEYWPEDQLTEALERTARECDEVDSARVRTLARALESEPLATSKALVASVWEARRPTVVVCLVVLLGGVVAGVAFLPLGRLRIVRLVLHRLGASLVTLLVIAYLALFGLIMAERGRERLPAEPLDAAGEALLRTFTYVTDHPTTYYWHRYEISALNLVAATFGRSAGLLLVSLGAAVLLGVPLGIAVALARRRGGASLVLLFSILGISTPSFLLAMVFWMVNIQVHRHLNIPALPSAGFGWDAHLVMPALVLAARPLAQIAQVTYVSLSEVLEEDYIRTARAKGLPWRIVRNRHAMRNVLIPILTTVGTSLRFSLASLPVIEYFFSWPGVGLTLLEAIEPGSAQGAAAGLTPLVTDLIVSLGLLFLLINLALELIYPLLDPRLRNGRQEERRERESWQGWLEEVVDALKERLADLRCLLLGARREERSLRPLPVEAKNPDEMDRGDVAAPRRSRWLLRNVLGNPALLIGALLVLGFLGLAVAGDGATEANPYEIHGAMIIEGEIGAPPFPPSSAFPWGTDHIGRDVKALVLAGARQTLALALFGMVARMLAGTILGMLAGWWQDSWLDCLVTGAVGVWAAFPVTLFAMIVIQALGIQQGMWVFVVALCVVGWGEVAQFVRGQVIGVKPQLYIEAARAIGARSEQILTRHALPALLASLLVLAVLEMGGVLMLLAELGFLNTFLGGGFKVEIAMDSLRSPGVTYFSDVPEWGALLANIRDWWRSYPWMAWYPGVAFFLSIVAFNLWGEGLRRFLAAGRVNVSRLFNRYTAGIAVALVLGLVWLLRSTAPLGVYRSQARLFDAQRAMEDVRVLASPEFQGRETGTPGARRAAEYIATRMKEIGLFPAGENDTFIQASPRPRFHLVELPRFEILNDEGEVEEELVYRRDFVEYAGPFQTHGECTGPVVGLSLGPDPRTTDTDPYGIGGLDLRDKVILVRHIDVERIGLTNVAGVLMVSEDAHVFQRKHLFVEEHWRTRPVPTMYVTPQVAERLLATAGSSLTELDRVAAELQPGEVAVTDAGASVHLETPLTMSDDLNEQYYDVVGFIPGIGSHTGEALGMGMDSQVIMVSAYYDGLGVGPDGTFYPGANDNASGVAAMLELARVLKEAPYQPKRTVVFVAWAGGERSEGLSVSNMMDAKIGFRSLTVEAVIELSGVGAGEGNGIALGPGSSFRLVQLFQEAAERLGVSTTTRGRGPHYGFPIEAGFGGRSALTAYLSWDGSDRMAHTPADTFETIDAEKLQKVGQTTLLALTVLSREVDY